MSIAATFAARSWIDSAIGVNPAACYNPKQPEQFLRLSVVTVGEIRSYPATFDKKHMRKQRSQQQKASMDC
jgi:hypothetical protein